MKFAMLSVRCLVSQAAAARVVRVCNSAGGCSFARRQFFCGDERTGTLLRIFFSTFETCVQEATEGAKQRKNFTILPHTLFEGEISSRKRDCFFILFLFTFCFFHEKRHCTLRL